MAARKKPLLLGAAGCGSMIVEFGLGLAGIACDYEEVSYGSRSPTRPRLLEVNPLGQVPAMVIPNGKVLTESLAILHWIQDQAPGVSLIPPPASAARADFYRWAVFIVAALYPTWTYGDDGKKWVKRDAAAGQALRDSTDEHRKKLLKQMEAACGSPYFLGKTFSAIDLYLAAMSHWRPGRTWWAENVPKLRAAADAAHARREIGDVIRRHFR